MTNTSTALASATAFATDDDLYAQPYIDIDEERNGPRRHRYIHGGFAGTANRFSFYLPVDGYEGRFFQHITPVPESEHLAPGLTGAEDKIGFAFSSGAFFVETNGGGAIDLSKPQFGVDPTIGAYRANAASAAFAKVVAQSVYGPHRTYGYAYGGSGGGFRTIACAENTRGVWDGFVPHVIGSPVAIPNVFTVRMHAMRVLRDVLDDIVDQVEPGSSQALGERLDAEQAAALEEVTRMGFPPAAWVGHRTMGTQAFGVLYTSLKAIDPSYFDDFWTLPGYLGADPSSSVHRDRVLHATTVVEVIRRRDAVAAGVFGAPAGPAGGVDEAFKGPEQGGDVVVALRLAAPPTIEPMNAELSIASGETEGSVALLQNVIGDLALVDFPELSPFLQQVRVGDHVEIDNSNFLAAQTYHRHQVPAAEFTVWDQFRDVDGTPLHPQRPILVGPLMARGASGTLQSGDIAGKMIVVEAGHDREAFPWQADWYAGKVCEHLGDETDEHLRVWVVGKALHADVAGQELPTHTVSYLGAVHQALREVAAWAEDGVEPAPSSRYEVVDGQVVLTDPANPGGVQPVVQLTADSGSRADVAVGEEVLLRVEAASTGSRIVEVRWDLDDSGAFAHGGAVDPTYSLREEVRHAFSSAGTHFVTVKVTAQQHGDTSTPFARVDNLARVRVVVG
ncbi:PKD domain-containing protein [Microbacterium sp. B2969]|uniref:PKD domain-containing protein n=1 Tax=Microbacterium alkaliflavum TaxID=3248839 RepID=A0ABW7Q439_9MICO